MRSLSPRSSEPIGRRTRLERVRSGDYFYSERALYWVEHVVGERALVEDCRTGGLIDVSASELLRLDRVNRS